MPSAINDGPVDPNNNFGFTITDSCHGIVQFNGSTNTGGALQWSWDFGDGATSSLQNPQHIDTNSKQLYTAKLTVKSITGCGYVERTKTIAAGGAFAKANFDFISNCDSAFVRFVTKSVLVPEDATIHFIWDLSDGNLSTKVNGHTQSGGVYVWIVKVSDPPKKKIKKKERLL